MIFLQVVAVIFSRARHQLLDVLQAEPATLIRNI